MQIDYYAYQSRLRRWNPGFKMLLTVGTLCSVLALNRLLTSLFVVIVMGTLTLLMGRTPWKVYLHYLLVPVSFLLVSCLVIAVRFSGSVAGDWNISLHFFYLYMTKKSLVTALQVFGKVMAGVSTLYMLSFSTPISELLFVLQRLHLPRLLIELMHLIYRYIFILFEAVLQMQTAAAARLGYRSFKQSCRTFACIGGNLFVLSMKKANSYYDAMLARGYRGEMNFLQEEKPVESWQVAGGVFYFLVLCFTAGLAYKIWR